MAILSNPQEEDVTLQLKEIKIKELSKWEQKSLEEKTTNDFTQKNMIDLNVMRNRKSNQNSVKADMITL